MILTLLDIGLWGFIYVGKWSGYGLYYLSYYLYYGYTPSNIPTKHDIQIKDLQRELKEIKENLKHIKDEDSMSETVDENSTRKHNKTRFNTRQEAEHLEILTKLPVAFNNHESRKISSGHKIV